MRALLNPFAPPQDALQTITNAEETPHKDGPTQVIEESLPATDSHAVQIQEFAESIAKLIQKAGAVKQDIDTIKAENGKHQEAEKEVSTGFCGRPRLALKFALARGECKSARSTLGGLCSAA